LEINFSITLESLFKQQNRPQQGHMESYGNG
jgi:hypothetical protein